MGMALMRAPAHVHQNRLAAKPRFVSPSKGNDSSGRFAQRGAKIAPIPQQFETPRFETPKSDSPGLLLLDNLLRPLYVNDEAISILSYPMTKWANGHAANFLKQRI